MIEYFAKCPIFIYLPMLDHLVVLFWKYFLIVQSSVM